MNLNNFPEKLNKRRPIFYWLPFHYHLVPGRLRVWLATHLLIPPPLSPNKICYKGQGNSSEMIQWPDGKKAAFTLSFDIDSESGLSSMLKLKSDPFFRKIKSTVNLVSDRYEFSQQDIDCLISDEWEIALHGDNHDARLPYLGFKKIEMRLKKAISKMNLFNLTPKGFRSPSLLYTETFFDVVGERFDYDSSMAFDDGENSAMRVLPFFIKNCLELPITMPMDVHLKFLQIENIEKIKIWKDRFEFIKAHNGYALLVIHPDSHFFDEKDKDELVSFLKYVLENNDVWIATSISVCKYFKKQMEYERE